MVASRPGRHFQRGGTLKNVKMYVNVVRIIYVKRVTFLVNADKITENEGRHRSKGGGRGGSNLVKVKF